PYVLTSQVDPNQLRFVNQPGESPVVLAPDNASVSGHGAFVVEVNQPVREGCRGGDRLARLGDNGQAPGPQVRARFQEQVPVPNGMVMFQKDEAWHGGRLLAGATVGYTIAGVSRPRKAGRPREQG